MPQQILEEALARVLLEESTEGRLATVSKDGQPYITPLNYIFWGDKIYFHCAREGRKLDNMAFNSKVCFEVSKTDKAVFNEQACKCSTRYTSVLVFGIAEQVDDAEEKARILNLITGKYARGRKFANIDAKLAANCSVISIKVDEISGKRNVDPPETK